MEQFSRSELYWGKNFQKSLFSRRIAVFGAGGVGGGALEGLARAGIGHFTIVDFDKVSKSNLNRQLVALTSTIGEKKAQVYAKRVMDINPDATVKIVDDFYDAKLNDTVFSEPFDFVVDAIDTLRSKIELICYCHSENIPLVSSFGAGNRVDASKLYCSKLEDVKPCCQFSKNVISKLKKHGVESGIQIVASSESPHSLEKVKNIEQIIKKDGEGVEFTKFTPASTPIVPTVAGFLMANYILNKFLEDFKGN